MINVLIGNNKELLDRFVSESKIEADSYIQSENLRDIKETAPDGEICFFASFSDRQKLLDFIRFSHSLRCNVTVIHELENGNLKEYFFPAYSLFSLFIKRLFDITVSLAGIVIGLPIWTVICICCAFSSGGSPIFRQKRVTAFGKIFKMCKFRSMYADSTEKGNAHWTYKGDERITPFGSFIRKHSIDEFAQLVNVLKGDMSLIGPRPERPELVEKFSDEIEGYYLRHLVKAGMSGWSQINGYRGNTSLEKRVEYDLYYQSHWSVLFDLKIFVQTFTRGLKDENAY